MTYFMADYIRMDQLFLITYSNAFEKKSLFCVVQIFCTQSKAKGIVHREYYCALSFPWPPVAMAPIRNLWRQVAVIWEMILAFHGFLVKVPFELLYQYHSFF